MKEKLRKSNFPLMIGMIIVTYLLAMSFYPQKFTSKDPVYEESVSYVEVIIDGKKQSKLINNPKPPSKNSVFGTDDAGRDVYTRLVYGTKNTMKLGFLIAFFRMLLALPLGILAGMGNKSTKWIINIFNTFFMALPMLIFSFIILNIGYFKSMQIDESIIAFAVVLTLVGWAKLAAMVEDSTVLVMEEDFIEGEIAIGKTKGQIAFQNVIPHIIPNTVSLFFKEMGLALFLVAQLAVFEVFVGATRQIKSLSFRANYLMNLEPEWGGMLSRISQNVKGFEESYWMVIFPVLAFTVAIVGLNLTGEGLRIEFQKKNSRVISNVKKITYNISPKVFLSQLRNIKVYYKPVITKALVIILVIAYIAIPWHPSKYNFTIDEAKVHLEELSSSKYEGRAAGTKGGNMAGDYIIDQLKSYGYQVEVHEIPLKSEVEINPLTESLKVNTTDILVPMVIEDGTISIIDKDGEEKTYNLHEDFTVITVSENMYKEQQGKRLNYKGVAANAAMGDQVLDEDEFFYISQNTRGFSGVGGGESNRVNLANGKSRTYDIMFMLDESYNSLHNPGLYKFTTIIPFGQLKDELKKGIVNMEINLSYPKEAEYPGRNIMAFLPGKSKTAEEPGKTVIIGASYDGVYIKDGQESYGMTAAPAATALEVARVIADKAEPLDKSVQFIFWDNEYDVGKYSMKNGSYYYAIQDGKGIDMALDHGYYYFDIGLPGYKKDENLDFVSYPAQLTDSNNYLMGLELQERLREMDIKFKRYFYGYSPNKGVYNMRTNALNTIGLGNTHTWGINTSIDNLDDINLNRMKDIGQIIIDTLTMNEYMLKLK